jgi:hypothetical protein
MDRELTNPEKSPYLFFFHNGITALCRSLSISNGVLSVQGLAVVNGCQSLSTIYATSGKIAQKQGTQGAVLFRFYEIPNVELGDAISVNTNSQSAVKPRDLRSNDKSMRQIKLRYESEIERAYFITKRGEERPSDKDPNRCIDSPDYPKLVISWLCQRPNAASNEKRLFDDYYKKLFSPQLDSKSMLALKLWLVEIDKHWESLAINEAVKAVKGAARCLRQSGAGLRPGLYGPTEVGPFHFIFDSVAHEGGSIPQGLKPCFVVALLRPEETQG